MQKVGVNKGNRWKWRKITKVFVAKGWHQRRKLMQKVAAEVDYANESTLQT